MTAGRRRTWAAIGLTAGAAALGGWAAPAGASVGEIAAGPNGSAHFAFTDGSPFALVHERSLAADGSLGGAQVVSQAYRGADLQVLGVDAAGNKLIAWRGVEAGIKVLLTRRAAADGTLSSIQRVTPAGADLQRFKLAVEPDGDAVYVWDRILNGRLVVQARRRAAATGALGSTQNVSYAAAEGYRGEVAVAPDGTATVAWLREPDGGGAISVQTRTIAPDGALGAIRSVAPPGDAVESLHVAVSGAGDAIIAWSPLEGGLRAVKSRVRFSGGTLGTTQSIAAATGGLDELRAAGDGAGRTVYAWSEYVAPDFVLRGRVRQPNGGLGAVFTVATAVDDPQVALDPNGNATFAWRNTQVPDGLILSRRRSVAGTLGTTKSLSSGGPPGARFDPRVVVDAGGKATISWHAGNEYLARTVTAAGTVSSDKRLDGL